jgi:hypothetical protein
MTKGWKHPSYSKNKEVVMRKETHEIELFSEGDKVITPCGKAIVLEDEVFDYSFPTVKVVLLEISGEHPLKGEVIELDHNCCLQGE